MRKQMLRMIGVMVGVFVLALPSSAQKFMERTGHWTIGGGLGITEDPSLYALWADVNYYITDQVAVGPLLQYAFKEDDSIFGVAGVVKYNATISGSKVVRPYGQVGIGFIQYQVDDLFDGDSKFTYLFPAGGGLEFKLADALSLDTNLLFNLSEEIFVGLFVGVNYIF